MTGNAQQHYAQWPGQIATMKEAAPDVARAFGGMFQKLMGEGALSVREKELIATGISMAVRCESCLYAHAEKAMKAGATREQILELGGVVVMMQGGPGYVWLPKLVDTLNALEESHKPVAA